MSTLQISKWSANNHRDDSIVQVPHEQKYLAIKMERQSVLWFESMREK